MLSGEHVLDVEIKGHIALTSASRIVALFLQVKTIEFCGFELWTAEDQSMKRKVDC